LPEEAVGHQGGSLERVVEVRLKTRLQRNFSGRRQPDLEVSIFSGNVSRIGLRTNPNTPDVNGPGGEFETVVEKLKSRSKAWRNALTDHRRSLVIRILSRYNNGIGLRGFMEDKEGVGERRR
jgi:hypothetical protein